MSGVHSTTDSNETHTDLADIMAHNVGTARHYCKLNEKSKSPVKASRQLRCVMRGENQQRESDPKGFPVVSNNGEHLASGQISHEIGLEKHENRRTQPC